MTYNIYCWLLGALVNDFESPAGYLKSLWDEGDIFMRPDSTLVVGVGYRSLLADLVSTWRQAYVGLNGTVFDPYEDVIRYDPAWVQYCHQSELLEVLENLQRAFSQMNPDVRKLYGADLDLLDRMVAVLA